MINQAYLHPWVRQKMHELLDAARRFDLAPIVTRTAVFADAQEELWRRCSIAQPGQQGFPVKESPCSQHEWGMAFDARATVELPLTAEAPPRAVGMAYRIFCREFPEICRAGFPRNTAPFAMGLLGRQLGLEWSSRDAVHFSAFTPGVWDPHMRSTFGLGCRTCTFPAGSFF